MSIRTAVLSVVLVSAVAPGVAGERPLPPWEWQHAERLQRRYDPSLAAERRRHAPQCSSGCGEGAIVVDGQVHPELLLPVELMDTLAGMYAMPDTARRDKVRALWLRRAPGIGRDGFWDDLYAAGRPFFDASVELHRLSRMLDGASENERQTLQARHDAVFETLCSRRAVALAAARALFGDKSFDRFLYQAIAPGVFITESSGSASGAFVHESDCQ